MTDTADLTLLRDSVRGALSGYPDALGLVHDDVIAPSVVADAMALAAGQGWIGMILPEADGGLGLGLGEAAIVAEELGRALAPGAFLANAALLPALAAASGTDWLQSLAAEVAEGRATVAIAFTDEHDGPAARRLVEHGDGATAILRVALTRTGPTPGLAIWRLDAPCLVVRHPMDPACPIAEWEGPEDAVPPDAVRLGVAAAESVLGTAQIWIAADLLGTAERAGSMSLAHAGERRQFGQPVGANQAVKHRIVDDYVLRRNAAVIVAEAAAAWDEGRSDRMLLAHAARAAATQAAIASTSHCIQVHGALGFSAESTVHLAYKRARRLACSLGDDGKSRAEIATRLLAARAA